MLKDKYSALWVSHSSINDFLHCPRAYYLKNVYKDPKTRHKITLMTPQLALGQSVHEVLERISLLPKDSRFQKPLFPIFDEIWKRVSGKKGGFFDGESEFRFKKRGEKMLQRIYENQEPLTHPAIKIKVKDSKDLPYFWLSDEENIILCGKIDWIEYLPEKDSIHIIDFKTGAKKEGAGSLQLPIYYLIARNVQARPVAQVSYWYLETDSMPYTIPLPQEIESKNTILDIARKIKLSRQVQKFECRESGCSFCVPFEKIIRGEAEYVGSDQFGRDTYVIQKETEEEDDECIPF